MITEANNRESETKTEVFAAYQELLGKLKATKKVTRLEEEKDEIVHREKQQQVEVMSRQAPQDLSRMLSELKILVNDSLKELEVQLVSEQERLVAIRQAVDFSNKELAELYDIRSSADTLAALLMAQREKSQSFEEEMTLKRLIQERELKEHKQAFENEIAERRRQLQQQEQDFSYQRGLAQERDRVELESRIRQLEEKEGQLEERARKMQQEFRQTVEDERRRIEQEMSLKFNYELKLSDKEMEAERKVFNQQIAALEAKIAHLESLKYSFNKLSFNSAPVDSIE